MSFERFHKNIVKARLIDEPRRFIQVVFGPRQVGKTTMISQLITEIDFAVKYVSADGVETGSELWIAQQWEAARINLKVSGKPEGLLIIDEVQKIRNWSEAVKKEWDTDSLTQTPLKVVLCGSSRLLIQQGLTESLAGRYETIYMGHWTFSEMKLAFGFDVNQFVWFGGYPGAALFTEDEKRWKHYVADSLIEASISKDIMMLTRIDKPALMKRLFETGCRYSGQIVSYTKVLGQLQDAGNTTTLAHYLRLLDTAGLLRGIEKYSSEGLRQKASSPKFQVYNTALISAQSGAGFQETLIHPEIWGRWVESAIGAYLVNYSFTEDFELFYWRNGNFEVDFVIQYKDKVVGIEVKTGAKLRISGIDAFKKQHNPYKIYLTGTTGIPLEQFLQLNPVELFV